jgi:hypothetical protein
VRAEGDVQILAPISFDMHLERDVEALALGAHDPGLALVRLDVDHGDEIRGEYPLVWVVDRQLAGEVDAPLDLGEEAAEHALRAHLGVEVPVALGRVRLGDGELGGEARDDLLSLGWRQLIPYLLGRSARVLGIDAVASSRRCHRCTR